MIGHVRSYDPEWIFACHVLACTAQSAAHLATLFDVAASATQEEVGDILGREVKLRGSEGSPRRAPLGAPASLQERLSKLLVGLGSRQS